MLDAAEADTQQQHGAGSAASSPSQPQQQPLKNQSSDDFLEERNRRLQLEVQLQEVINLHEMQKLKIPMQQCQKCRPSSRAGSRTGSQAGSRTASQRITSAQPQPATFKADIEAVGATMAAAGWRNPPNTTPQ